jgi:hypothetical protein
MDKGIFTDREKAMEANYFRQQDAKLIERLRAEAKLDDIAIALAEKLQVDHPELLARAKALGLTADTASAIFAAPLVQVAWAEGSVSKQEERMVLRLAADRGIEEESPAGEQLREWLAARPADDLFDTATEIIKAGFAVLPIKEREERIQRLVDACHKVAAASGAGLISLIGLSDGVSRDEASMLDAINKKLRLRG